MPLQSSVLTVLPAKYLSQGWIYSMLDYVSDSLIYMCCAKLLLLLLLSRFSHVRLCVTLWTAAHQALLSTGFFRQEYWSGLSSPSPLSCFSRVQLFVTLWTVVHQYPLSMGFSRQEYWSGLLCLSPGDLPNPGIEPVYYGFSSGHVWMWEFDYKESWAQKNGCFFNCGVGELLGVPGTARRSNQSILKEISPECSLEGLLLKLKLQYFGHLMRCWERLKAGGKGDDRGWDGWMASPTRWTWFWADSGSWWWTGRPGVLWFMGLQRVGHDWATALNWTLMYPALAGKFFTTSTTGTYIVPLIYIYIYIYIKEYYI